jgi:hypothetical protein
VTDVDALQETLAAEHTAVYVYGVLGGRAAALSDEPLRASLETAYDAHVTRRDELRRMIAALGSDPVAAEPAYRLPPTLTTTLQIAAQALRTERACVEQYGALVGAEEPGPARDWGIAALAEAAVTELRFGSDPRPLPGLTVVPTPLPSAGASTVSPSADPSS